MNATLILIILLLGVFCTYFAGNTWAKTVALLFSFCSLIASIYLCILYTQGQSVDYQTLWITDPNIYLAFKIDGLSIAMVLLTTILIPIIIFSSFGNEYKNSNRFYALILLMSLAMNGTFLSADAFVYYIFWELALIPIYFIALSWGNGDVQERKKAIVTFFIFTLAGSLCMLVAFIYIFEHTGSVLHKDILNLSLTLKEENWVFIGLFMAYAIKIPIIPFHSWQANTYQKSPNAGTMLLSGIMLKMGLYSIIRWQLPLAPNTSTIYMNLLMGVCIAGVVYGSIVALKQRNIKKLLAYSSLAHVGLIAAGIYTQSLDGLRGAVMQMLAHGLVVVGLFFAIEVIERRYKTQLIAEMGGIRTQESKFTSMFLIILFASIALPGTFNFVGEFALLYSTYTCNIWFAIVAGSTVILGAFYMLRMFQQVMLGETNTQSFAPLTWQETSVFMVIIALLLGFGIYPKPIYDLITPTLVEIISQINPK